MCCSAGRFETLTLHALAETFCSQIKIGILVEIGMQESMFLVSLYVTRMENYGGHFRSAMRAEVCQMCRLTGWDGLFLWLLGRAGSYWCSASSGSNMIPKWVANCRPKTGLGWPVSVWSNTCWLQGNSIRQGAFIKKSIKSLGIGKCFKLLYWSQDSPSFLSKTLLSVATE